MGHLFALNRIAKRNPDAFETKSDVITAFILKSVLITPDTEEEVGHGLVFFLIRVLT